MTARLLPLILLAGAAAGCLILPIPTAKHTPDDAMTRGEIEKRALRPLRVGTTSVEDVLLRFGEPDAVSPDGRWLLYRWLTVGGYLLIAGGNSGDVVRMGADRHDLLFEFDASGLLVRFGELETLVAQGLGDDLPVDSSSPLQIEVLYGPGLKKDWPARLVLTPKTLTIESDSEKIQTLTLPADRIRQLDHDADDDDPVWYAGWLAYHLDYVDEKGRKHDLHLQIDALSLPRLARYLREYCAEIKITE
jgi:hypothetical protein